MKIISTFILILALLNNLYSQSIEITSENFEKEFMKFKPVKRENVSDENFSNASFFLEGSKNQIDNLTFTSADYLNAFTIFRLLKEPREHIELAFTKFAESQGSCYYILNMNEDLKFSETVPTLYEYYFRKCSIAEANKNNDSILNLKEYALQGKFNLQLVELMNEIDQNDQKYRGKDTDLERQKSLDKTNQILIDSLYNEYGEYIGSSFVGQEFESIMWAVIQHSNIKMMEKYLPIVREAVVSNNLHETPLKMLIDRIYWIKYNYQIFGSQAGVSIADSTIRNEVKQKYGF